MRNVNRRLARASYCCQMAIYRNVAILAAFVAGLLLVVALRFLQVVRQTHAGARRPRRAASKPSHRSKRHPCRLVVFLGSGGHTGEMLRLLCGLDFEQYAERVYLVSSGDALSLAKVAELEKARAAKPHTTPTTVRLPLTMLKLTSRC